MAAGGAGAGGSFARETSRRRTGREPTIRKVSRAKLRSALPPHPSCDAALRRVSRAKLSIPALPCPRSTMATGRRSPVRFRRAGPGDAPVERFRARNPAAGRPLPAGHPVAKSFARETSHHDRPMITGVSRATLSRRVPLARPTPEPGSQGRHGSSRRFIPPAFAHHAASDRAGPGIRRGAFPPAVGPGAGRMPYRSRLRRATGSGQAGDAPTAKFRTGNIAAIALPPAPLPHAALPHAGPSVARSFARETSRYDRSAIMGVSRATLSLRALPCPSRQTAASGRQGRHGLSRPLIPPAFAYPAASGRARPGIRRAAFAHVVDPGAGRMPGRVWDDGKRPGKSGMPRRFRLGRSSGLGRAGDAPAAKFRAGNIAAFALPPAALPPAALPHAGRIGAQRVARETFRCDRWPSGCRVSRAKPSGGTCS